MNPSQLAIPYQRHSRTSRAAALEIADHVTELQQRVLDAIGDGATDEEIQERTGLDPSTERPRRVELVRRGLVRDSGKRRPTRSGRAATVWVREEGE